MIYENIQGWFNYEGFYDMMIDRFDKGIFVEIGAWKGRSACYMGEKIKESGKRISYYVVDNFKGNPGSELHSNDPDIINGTLKETFLRNTESLRDYYIRLMEGDSGIMHEHFRDKTISFLFVDGDHSYKAVKSDIQLWLPKMKDNGVISGHDYDNPEVKRAVDELFPERKIWGEGCLIWYVEL